MKRTSFLSAIFAATMLIGVGQGSAATVNLRYDVAGKAFGNEAWYTGVKQTIKNRGNPIGRVYRGQAGAFRFHDGVSAFIAFCIDPYTYLKIGEAFEVTKNASVSSAVDRLFTSSYRDVTDAASAAAFQVALWEVLAETDKVYDASKGNHSVAGAALQSRAQSFLDRIATASTGGYRYTIYSNSGQDQIRVSPVPLPASALLLIAGLGGLVTLRRKQR